MDFCSLSHTVCLVRQYHEMGLGGGWTGSIQSPETVAYCCMVPRSYPAWIEHKGFCFGGGGSVSILKHYLVLLFMCAQCIWGGFICHCTCVEVQRIAFGVGSLLSPLYGFFMQVTKGAGHTALLAELSHQPSICMSADVETKPVRFMHLQKQRTT